MRSTTRADGRAAVAEGGRVAFAQAGPTWAQTQSTRPSAFACVACAQAPPGSGSRARGAAARRRRPPQQPLAARRAARGRARRARRAWRRQRTARSRCSRPRRRWTVRARQRSSPHARPPAPVRSENPARTRRSPPLTPPCAAAAAVAFEISRLLDTGLDRETLSILIALVESGVHPEALAAVVKELRREAAELKARARARCVHARGRMRARARARALTRAARRLRRLPRAWRAARSPRRRRRASPARARCSGCTRLHAPDTRRTRGLHRTGRVTHAHAYTARCRAPAHHLGATRQPRKPASSAARSSLRPMKTILLMRGSPGAHCALEGPKWICSCTP